MNDIWPYIFSLIKHKREINLVCKYWRDMYIKATEIYSICIHLDENIDNNILEKFNTKYSLKLNFCEKITSFGINFTKLRGLGVIGCENVTEINLPDLEELTIYNCRKINKLHNFAGLEALRLWCSNVAEMPYSICLTLKTLKIYESNITFIPDFNNLENLQLIYCENITKLPNSIITTLEKLSIFNCKNIMELPNFTKLKKLNLYMYIKKLPDGIVKTLEKLYLYCYENINTPDFQKLKILDITYSKTEKFICLPNSQIIKTLEILCVDNCVNLTEIPSFTNLKVLSMMNCLNLTGIPDTVCNTLTRLTITKNLEGNSPDILSKFKNLKVLNDKLV